MNVGMAYKLSITLFFLIQNNMLYHPSDSKITIIIKHLVFWSSLIVMFGLFLFLFHDEINIPQREISLEVDIKNKVNICSPDDPKMLKKSFFNF